MCLNRHPKGARTHDAVFLLARVTCQIFRSRRQGLGQEKAASTQLKILLDESKTKEAHLQSQANTLVERFENGNLV